jgi:hypothetical protein
MHGCADIILGNSMALLLVVCVHSKAHLNLMEGIYGLKKLINAEIQNCNLQKFYTSQKFKCGRL